MATLKGLVDETTNIKNEIKTCHINLKNNLIEKGVECSNNDKLSSLVDKISNIELGKKCASGSMSNIITSTSATSQTFIIETNLSFIPSRIVLNIGLHTLASTEIYNVAIDSSICYSAQQSFYLVNGSKCYMYIHNITKDSFSISTGKYKSSMVQKFENITWYAFE